MPHRFHHTTAPSARLASRGLCACVTAAWLFGAPLPSRAADSSERPQPTGENHYFAKLGPALAPEYEGADHYEVYPLPIVGWIRDGVYARLEGDTLLTNVIPMSLFEFGPAARWQRKRDDIDDERVDRLRDVSGALSMGALAGVWLRDPEEPLRQAGLRAMVLHDVSGSHDGYEIKLNAMGGLPLTEKWSLVVDVYSRYASDNYMDTYFSIDADNARRSALAPFRASAGFRDVGADATLTYMFNDHWGAGLTVSYTRLIGDAGDSPIVATAGSRNQFVGAITLNVQY